MTNSLILRMAANVWCYASPAQNTCCGSGTNRANKEKSKVYPYVTFSHNQGARLYDLWK